ncbi:MAG: hypothetical protein RIQ53_4756 [Pseudomonadota bacterium]|jgi:DNA-binding GntR family transcriptional regulator
MPAASTDPAAEPSASAPNAAPLTEQAMYERIVAAVLDRRLPPGTKLVEDKLAQAFGVSRTRVRPVLVRLANERIVTLSPNRGATVAQPTAQEALEVFEVRQLIEPTLVDYCIARADALAIDALERNIDDEEQARGAGDLRRAIRLSGEFHHLIAQAAGHQTLGRILHELVSRTSLVLMSYGRGPAEGDAAACGCGEHRALLQAIRKRQSARAQKLMREHLAHLQEQLQLPGGGEGDAPDLSALLAAP